MKKFKLTENHIKLLRRMYVGWQDCDTGAPEIDPKRPYGNDSVANDIHEILTGESIGLTTSKREELTEAEERKYLDLHREMEIALQVVLASGQFVAGNYCAPEYTEYWRPG